MKNTTLVNGSFTLVLVAGESVNAVLAKLRAADAPAIGGTSLRKLLAGEAKDGVACGYSVVEIEAPTEKPAAPKKEKKTAPVADGKLWMAYNHNDTELMIEPSKSKAAAQKEASAYTNVTGNAAYVVEWFPADEAAAEEVVAPAAPISTPISTPVIAKVEIVEAPKVEGEVVPAPKAMRKDSKMHKVALMLVEGASLNEIMVAFNYSSGGAGSTLFCKQAGILSKGYEFSKEAVEGRGTVMGLMFNGKPVTAEQIVTK